MTDRNISRIFTDGDESSGLLVSWWEALDQDRGERANLRRASGPSEVAFGSSFHKLLGRLRAEGYSLGRDRTEALAAVAGLAAARSKRPQKSRKLSLPPNAGTSPATT